MMTDAEFDLYHAQACEELETKQRRLETEFGLGSHERFNLDFESCKLQFFDDERLAVEAIFTPVGSFVPDKQSWRWAWANTHLPEQTRHRALAVQGLYEETGLDVFRNETASFEAEQAWETTALACKFLGSLGAYTAVNRKLRVYVVLDNIIRTAE